MKPRYYALIAIAASVTAGAILFITAQKVQMADANLRHLEADTMREKQTLHVLHAEWDYLNRPDRLEALAKAHLNMVPPQAGEIAPPKQKSAVAEGPHPGPLPTGEGGTRALAREGEGLPPQPNSPVTHSFQSMLDNLNKPPP